MTVSSATVRLSALTKALCLFVFLVAGASETCARMFDPELGRWTRRDPLGYIDGMNVYEYVRSAPLSAVDPHGFERELCTNGLCHIGGPLPTLPLRFFIEYAKCCEEECEKDTRAAGIVACCYGQVIPCICPENWPPYSSCFAGAYGACLRGHEQHNTLMYECDDQDQSRLKPGVTGTDLMCNEAEAYGSEAACISSIDCDANCTDTDECERWNCEYAKKFRYVEAKCRERLYQENCDQGGGRLVHSPRKIFDTCHEEARIEAVKWISLNPPPVGCDILNL